MASLLFISQRVPYPPNKGEKLRAFNQIRILSRHYEVTVVCNVFNSSEIRAAEKLKKFCKDVWPLKRTRPSALVSAATSMLSGRSATEGYFAASRLAMLVDSKSAGQKFDIVMGYCSGVLPAILSCPANKGRLIDIVDADSAKWLAYAQAAGFIKKIVYDIECHRVEQLEQLAIDSCGAVIVTAKPEADILSYDRPCFNLHIIANGVDSDYFSHNQPADDPVIIFTGTMNYQPNIDAVRWFAGEVWPNVKTVNPKAKFIIAGRNPDHRVRELEKTGGITVTGEVKDIRNEFSRASIAIAPLKIARGVQNKVLEAMAAGPAVIATPEAIEGIDAREGHDYLSATEPDTWVTAIEQLFADRTKLLNISNNARALVEDKYNWPGRLKRLIEICKTIEENGSADADTKPGETFG